MASNIKIEQNEFSIVDIGIHFHHLLGVADGCTFANNVFYDCVTNGIFVEGTMTNAFIINNILHGNATGGAYTNVGISITSATGNFANNDTYDFTTTYAGSWTPGSGNKTLDPLFVDPGNYDFKLSAGSPCIDAGGFYGILISPDIRGVTRPQIIPGYPMPGNGVDMGVYEMLESEIYATYYVNASGSNESPYTTRSTGALNFGTLFDNVTPDDYDTISVVDNGVVNDSTNVIASIAKSVKVISDSSNSSNPSISVNNDVPLFSFVAGSVSPVVRDLDLSKPGPDATSNFINFADYELTAPEVSGCGFSIQDTSGADARGIVFSDNVISSVGTVEGNSFDDLTDGVYSIGSS